MKKISLIFVIIIIIVITMITLFLVNYFSYTSQEISISDQKSMKLSDSIFIETLEGCDINIEQGCIATLFSLDPAKVSLYNEIGVRNDLQKTAFIFPSFTASAYMNKGFYDYYKSDCDETCLTVKINNEYPLIQPASGRALQTLGLLGYELLNDITVDQNPEILFQYDKIIVLHNEYVTQKIFDAITNHPKVIFLYPNALYAQVSANYEENTITLIRGHGYPEKSISNGFGWKFDNSKFEYDLDCYDWNFYEIENGLMLNCFPENIIHKSPILLKKIKDF